MSCRLYRIFNQTFFISNDINFAPLRLCAFSCLCDKINCFFRLKYLIYHDIQMTTLGLIEHLEVDFLVDTLSTRFVDSCQQGQLTMCLQRLLTMCLLPARIFL